MGPGRRRNCSTSLDSAATRRPLSQAARFSYQLNSKVSLKHSLLKMCFPWHSKPG
ncbi:hypothetical protein HMPREF0972_01318 [Actinomyces sp. oral taxon 848 str. F0332]|nr:hypothetical protein HMPREF0972_01318 [Actinomyces sp. oral taxon 848 str. F0332]